MAALSQPGVFNVLDYNMKAGDTSHAQANASALVNVINLAQATANLNGAIILIPSFSGTISAPQYGPYYIDTSVTGPITIPNTGASSPLLILGTGTGTTLINLTPNTTLFRVQSSSFVAFQDLTIIDQSAETQNNPIGTAFDFNASGTGSTSEGYKLFRVNIIDFPRAVYIENSVIFVNVLQCSISYDANYSGVKCIAIYDSGAETNVEQCSLIFATQGSTTGMVGIEIVGASYGRVSDSQISGFETGISLGAGTSGGVAIGASFSGLDVDAIGSCVNIIRHVYDACFVSCSFAPTVASPPPSLAGINIGTVGDSNLHYDTIRFTACTVAGYGLYGMQINVGQNIQVNGGSYSGNGTAGIAILGGAAEIQITGANCIGTSNAGSSQQYGIYITSGQDIQIVGANCSGNSVSGIRISGSEPTLVSNVRVVGAICANSVLGGISQNYGIYVSAASGVLIDGCTLTGNTLYALFLSLVQNVTVIACDVYSAATGAKGIHVDGSPLYPTNYVFIRGCNGGQYSSIASFLEASAVNVGNLEVTDCAGYNDQHAILANTNVAPSSFTAVTYGYFGPAAFYLASATATTVTIDGASTHLTSGSFTLAPRETASIGSGTIINFLMIGK